MVLIMAIQYPVVQTKLAQFASKKLSKLINFPVSVNSVCINWFDVIQFNNVIIKDTTHERMIDVTRLEVDFKLKTLIYDGDIYIDNILIAKSEIRLVKYQQLNIDQFIQNIRNLSKKNKKIKKKVPKLHIDAIDLSEVRFFYDSKKDQPLRNKKFDPNHIDFQQLTGKISKLRITSDTIELQIDKLSGYESNIGLNIKEISTFFRHTKKNMSFTNLYVSWGESVLRDSVVFKYRNANAFSDFINQVQIYANIKQSIIATKDLAYFVPALYDFKETLSLSGNFKGTVSNFRLKNMNLSFGEKSRLEGSILFTGLPDFFETLLDLNFKNSEIHAQDLKQYIPNKDYRALKKFGDIAFDAEFVGFINDFATKGQFFTDLGQFTTDVNLKTASNYYKGALYTKKFNLGRLIDNKLIQLIDIEGDIEGTGLSLKTANFKLNAHLNRLGINGYDYMNIDTDGHFQERLFSGELEINDPNIHLNIKGEINLLDSDFNFTAQLDSVNLKKLNIFNDTLTFSTVIKADFKGLNPNDIIGEITLLDNDINYKSKYLHIDKINIKTSIDKRKQRQLKLFSDFIHADLKGNFNFARAVSDLPRLLHEYQLSISRNDSLLKVYYTPQYVAKTKKLLEPYDLRFNLKTNNLDLILKLFMDEPPHISQGATIDGEMTIGKNSDFFITTQIDTILLFDGTEFTNNSFTLSTDKHFDQEDFNAEFMMQSGVQKFGELQTNKFSLYGFRHEHSFIIDSKINHPELSDYINLKGNLDVYPEHFEVNLTNTDFRFLNKIWKNAGINKIVVDSLGVLIKDLSFVSNKQKVTINGNITTDTVKNFVVNIQNFDLKILNAYTEFDLTGRLNIDASFEDIYREMKVSSKIKVDSLHINNYLIGDLFGKTEWDNKYQKLIIDVNLTQNKKEIIKITGGYSPNEERKKQLDLSVILQAASLEIGQPFVEGNISDLTGTAIGYLNIKGPASTPNLIGDILIIDGKFKLDYLNTTYSLDDKIYFKKDFIGFKKLKLIDENHHFATLNGGLWHQDFQNMKLDLNGRMKNFQVLNTESNVNALYYGKAYASGSFDVTGDFANIKIDVNAKSEKGTKLYIPLQGSENVIVQDYISFVSSNTTSDTLETINDKNIDLSGIVLNFNLDITPDAYMEIIFDKKTGDIIKGNGLGKLNMSIDTKGEFNMYGDIEITKGQYNFTLLNVIDKKFTVKPNSHITWTGNPYGAQLDIIASYTQRASLVPIMDADSSITSHPYVKRRYPVEVLLGLKGDLMSPNINFGIDIIDYPSTVVANGIPLSLESYVAAFKQRIKNDEQELNRQAFSLIVLHKLSDNKFAIASSASSSVSELLTNQLSYWVSQVDENLEIDVDLNGLDKDALNSFQLRLSYTFLDGRLRVTWDGNFTNVQNQTNATNLFGDWTVEYLLASDGHLNLKMYHKQNNNTALTNIQNSSSSGFSLLHTKNFNRITDFFVPLKKQAIKDEQRKLKAKRRMEKKNYKKTK